jgi:hypothetical protein
MLNAPRNQPHLHPPLALRQSAFVAALGNCGYFFLTQSHHYIYGAYLLIAIQVALGISICMYNAYIPELSRTHPKFVQMMDDYKNKRGEFDPNKKTGDLAGKDKKGKKKRAKGATELLVKNFALIQVRTFNGKHQRVTRKCVTTKRAQHEGKDQHRGRRVVQYIHPSNTCPRL